MNTEWLYETPIAHRGLHDNIDVAENTLRAFEAAINGGYGIELDVHLTKDKKLVVFHDDSLERMCGINKIVENLTYGELKTYELFATGCKMPLLEEVLTLAEGKAGVLIEVKTGSLNVIEICSVLLEELNNYTGEYAVESFNPRVITYLYRNRPDIIRGQLSSYFPNKFMLSKFFLKRLMFAKSNRPHFIAYDVRYMPNKYIEKHLTAFPDTKVIAWTVKTREQLAAARTYACNYIFDTIDPTKN